VLAPQALDDFSPAIELAQQAIKKDPDDAESQSVLGALLYRAGQFHEARKHLYAAAEAATRAKTSVACTAYFLAMTHHQLGDAEDARHWLTRANEQADQDLSSTRRLTLPLFRQEASELLTSAPHAPE
jgi:Flp pilus assembly protein TadD